MRRILFVIVLLGLAGCACPTGHEATRIETDQKTGAVRIISDNREVARFGRDGLLYVPAGYVSGTGFPAKAGTKH